MADISDIEDISVLKPRGTIKDIEVIKLMILDYYTFLENDWDQYLSVMRKKYKITPPKPHLLYAYHLLLDEKKISQNFQLEQNLISKKVRGQSGVMVFTEVMTPFPETGIINPDFKDGIFFINNGEISNNGTKVRIDETGKIIELEADVKLRYIKRVTLDKITYGEKILKLGESLIDIMNPVTGEFRQSFSCPFNCYYCPDESIKNGAPFDMPRSYLATEPAVARNFSNGWNCISSIRERFFTYLKIGHTVDKGEFIIEGGTYTCYPKEYRIRYMRDIYYAANTIYDKDLRSPLRLDEEIFINETAKFRVIGITIETRPDYITDEDIIEFRECGITRIQLGVQHTDNEILKKINRQCTTEQVIKTIKKLKDAGFKIDIHIMPDLPFSSFEKDKIMIDDVINNEMLQIDQIKFYPTVVVPYTEIIKWYNLPEGHHRKYTPYFNRPVDGKNLLIELGIYFKSSLKPWHRTNRIQRDIPTSYIEGGSNITNLGQILTDEMKKRKLVCCCIRCREVRDKKVNISDLELNIRNYKASDGTEYFLSFETKDKNIICGFLRLRMASKDVPIFEELNCMGLIRELHVYGTMTGVGEDGKNIQHKGLGTALLAAADGICREKGLKGMCVISGVGVREYYKKRGFVEGKYYLNKYF